MRYFSGLVFLVFMAVAHALTPLPDSSPAYFSGEWVGTGEHGAYCYVNLSADGWGWVLIDNGSGDWLGARMQWRNLRQSLQLDQRLPLPASAHRRTMPLGEFSLGGGFNQSLTLRWKEPASACQLQKIEAMSSKRSRARSVIDGAP